MNSNPSRAKRVLRTVFLLGIAFFVASLIQPRFVHAEEGEPVAIRFWNDQAVTIETMWDFQVGLRIFEANRMELERACDLEILNVDVQSKYDGLQTQAHFWNTTSEDSFVFDRLPNERNATWKPSEIADNATGNAVRVSLVKLVASTSKDPLMLNRFDIDGVAIVDCDKHTLSDVIVGLKENPEAAKSLVGVDAMLIGASGPLDGDHRKALAELVSPRMVVMPMVESIKDAPEGFTAIQHNTVAVSAKHSDSNETSWIMLGSKPYEMNAEVTELFAKKEAACRDSRGLFAQMSVEQLNFKPANGTHTPRWNVEHMMGRELLFFSQIYGAADPMIPVMDLNPKQMPKDYEFKHEDWEGGEEAAQMQRVQSFTRRFAYLLDGVDLDKKAKGSRWPPRALLLQMDRHYSEHTNNVRKKMELPEWPKREQAEAESEK